MQCLPNPVLDLLNIFMSEVETSCCLNDCLKQQKAGCKQVPSSSHVYFISNTVNIAYMSGTLWCVSLEGCVAARTCLPVDSPRETAGAVPPATGGTRHGTAAVDPSNIAATTIGYRNKYISPPHIHMLQENWKQHQGGSNEILGIHFHIFKLPIAAKTEAIYLLVWVQHRQRSSAGSSFGKFKCRI